MMHGQQNVKFVRQVGQLPRIIAWCTVNKTLKTHILCSAIFFFENRAICENNAEEYSIAGDDTDENTAHVYCVLDT